MLVELSISDFAIIESLRLQFSSGFSVLTGETGAGKSIIIDAVSLLLGGRASTELIRTGCEEASVEGVFVLPERGGEAIASTLRELGLDSNGDDLIVRREISHSRRNICRVNGRAVTLSALQEIGSHLIDIHGQGDHLSLLQVRSHVDFLDRFGGLLPQRQAFSDLVARLRMTRREIDALRRDERELARRVDLLTYQTQEIENARLDPTEEQELLRERGLLANAEKRMRLAAEAYELLEEGGEEQRSVTDLLSAVSEAIQQLAQIDEAQREEAERVETALYQLEDTARTLRTYRDGVEFDPAGLELLEERLDLIRSLERKYGDTIEDVLAFGQRAQSELDTLSHGEERLEELAEQEIGLKREMAVLGAALGSARAEVAAKLSTAIEKELSELSMERARFVVDAQRAPDPDGVVVDGVACRFSATGIDQIEFLIAPNPGEEPRPLARVASGGETSRLMLAMKTALSSVDPVPTLIFDEVDAGIGGRTGTVVGRKLWSLAQTHQVFCVTHLAQIASFGAHHFRVAKDLVEGRTVSVAQELATDYRIEELAVMLGGTATETARRNAEELLRRTSTLRESQE